MIFFAKNFTIKWKIHFKELILFDTHFTANWPPLPILKKNSNFFFKKSQVFFSKKPKFCSYLKYLTISESHSTANLLMKLFQIQNHPPVILPGQLASKRLKNAPL